MKTLDLLTVSLDYGETYKYGDYEVTVCRKYGVDTDKYNVSIEKGFDVSSCHGLTCQEVLSLVGCTRGSFVEPQRTPVERGDGVIRHSQFDVVLDLVEMDIPVYLYGPAGSGKNILCKQIADELGLDFYFSNSVTQEYKITGFIDAGAKVLTYLRDLESQGYRVNLYIIMCSSEVREQIAMMVKVKDSEQYLNITKTAYPIVNPDFLRRHFIRLIECEATDRNFASGYGAPIYRKSDIQNVFDACRLKVDKYLTFYEVQRNGIER